MNISKKQFSIIIIISLVVSILPFTSIAQTKISGLVTQKNGTPIDGANVYLETTYDGSSTDEKGYFSFTTEETGLQTLIVSNVTYESFKMLADVTQMLNVTIQLREDVNSLDTVIISAGTFEAGDNSKVSVLKPLDVVTTASALGDFVGALQTLPGTTTVAEDGRLFVRGGDAEETQIFIDGIRVFTPYTPTTNNVPTRGRYSPFLFDGITFSTGGYAAEYGQALSSVLLLNTIDEPVQDATDIAIMSVGGGIGNTQKWEKSSLSLNTSYINLAPYIAAFPDRNDWIKPYEAVGGESVFRRKFEKGLFKFYAAFDVTNFELIQEDINLPGGLHFKLKNINLYSNAGYSGDLGESWKIMAGGSYTHANNKVGIVDSDIIDIENSAHLKLKFRKRFSNRVKLNIGAEQFLTDFVEEFENPFVHARYGFNNNITAAFTEADLIFSRQFAMKLGVRGEYSYLFDQFTVSPRTSLAYKTGKSSQISVAYGDFYQQPLNAILKFQPRLPDGQVNLEAQKTQHYILNYQYSARNRIFRAEAYRKQYDNLITFDGEFPGFDNNYTNDGDGYAQGIDIFWRDDNSIKNVDYWVSYSYLDTKRMYLNYPTEATPSFANTHNLSVVGKYWVGDWKSQFGISYQYASGRSYTNPNEPGFLQEKTRAYNSLSINCAYLISQQKILYFSINNLPGFTNINSYQYTSAPDINGNYNRRAVRPAADQFFFVGFFWTISEDGTKNQLDNL